MPKIVGIEKKENISLQARVEVVEFPFSFVPIEDMDKNNKFHKKQDNTIKEKLTMNDNYRIALMLMLLETHKNNRGKQFVIPDKVQFAKRKYFNESDKFKNWFMENIVKTGNIDNEILANDIHASASSVIQKLTKTAVNKDLQKIVGVTSENVDLCGMRNKAGVHTLVGYRWIG